VIERVILHVDMDAFYASVEVREEPALAGKPLIIGRRGRRGVVTTCSYEARKFGVRSAMPSVTAQRLCPQAVWRSGRMSLYSAVSRQIRLILDDFSPLVEPISIDEAFLDASGIAFDLEAGRELAARLKERIRHDLRLSASVGVAPNKFLAKVASDLEKPDGLTLLSIASLPQKFWPLPIERLWGVGPKMAERIHRGGIRRIGELLRVSEDELSRLCGARAAAHLRGLARGEDSRRVVPRRRAKSISEERTYGADLTEPDRIDRALLARSTGVARHLRRSGLVGTTVHIKVRTGDFTTWTRAHTLATPTDLTEPIVEAARRLFRERIHLGGRGVRLLGVGVSGLDTAGSGQLRLFASEAERKARRAALAADAVRRRMGDDSITRARLIPSSRVAPPRR